MARPNVTLPLGSRTERQLVLHGPRREHIFYYCYILVVETRFFAEP
jgi:hypothetical protein